MLKAALTLAALIAIAAPSFAASVTPHTAGPIAIPYPRVTVAPVAIKVQVKVGSPISGTRRFGVDGEATHKDHTGGF